MTPLRQKNQRGPHLVEPEDENEDIMVHPRRYSLCLTPTPTSGPHYIAAHDKNLCKKSTAIGGTSAFHQSIAAGGTRAQYVKATHHLLPNSVIDEVTGQYLEYQHLVRGPNQKICTNSLANDLGQLAQEIGTCMPTVTSTVFFIRKCNVPNGDF